MKNELFEGDIDATLLDTICSCAEIAVDCETSGLDWQNDSLALIQLHTPETGTLYLRPLDSSRPCRLISILESPRIKKIFHHAMFDLRFLVNTWSFVPSYVTCTKILSKLLDPEGVQSLKPLLKNYLGIEISKELQTSDWQAVELSKEQLRYASNDVVHLAALEFLLWSQLKEVGLDDLALRCCEHLPARVKLDLLGYPDIYQY